jgi:hypothetical protein
MDRRHLVLANERAHEVARLDLVGEIDRRRRALALARGMKLIKRLAEPDLPRVR